MNSPAVKKEPKPKGILLIGNPRSLTTAFEHYMYYRGDFKTYFEPVMGQHFKVLTTQGVAASQKIDIDLFMNQLLANAPKRFFIKELAFIFKDSKAHRILPELLTNQ